MTICRNNGARLGAVTSCASSVPDADTQVCARPMRILRLAQVIRMTGLGKTTIYALQAEGTFPMRVQITAHSVGWIEEEVQTWLWGRVATSSRLNTEHCSAANRTSIGFPAQRRQITRA